MRFFGWLHCAESIQNLILTRQAKLGRLKKDDTCVWTICVGTSHHVARRYVDSCGSHRLDLIKQEDLVQQLRKVGRHVKDTVDAERLSVLRNDLRQMVFPKGGVRLPVNSAFRVNGIIIEKCRYMDSAKKPIWCGFCIALTHIQCTKHKPNCQCHVKAPAAVVIFCLVGC